MKLLLKRTLFLFVAVNFLFILPVFSKLYAQNPQPGELGGPCRITAPAPKCNVGYFCINNICARGTTELIQDKCPVNNISTAIGCVPLGSFNLITKFFLGWALGIAGGLALLLIVLSAYRIATSQGDPRRLQGGQELLFSAIGGLIMVVLSVYLLRFIGVDLLGLFSQ